MSTYKPQPGTIPARIVDHLAALPAGAELSSSELCEALQLDVSGPLGAYMVTAIKHGAVVADTRDVPGKARRVTYWSLGDGTPPHRRAVDDEPQEPDEKPVPKSAWPFPRPASSVFELAGASSGEEKAEADTMTATEAQTQLAAGVTDMAAAAAPALDALFSALLPFAEQDEPPEFVDSTDDEPENDPEPFVCALWSDGRLQLQRDGAEMLLDLYETKALLRYLNSTRALEMVGVHA